jgi:hypothetical protein
MMFTYKRKIMAWLSIGSIVICGSLLVKINRAEATFGEDIPFLIQIITQTIEEISELSTIISAAQNTASVLQEMNQGVKDVLRLADTAHIPLPPQVYQQARDINQAAQLAQDLYGTTTGSSPKYTQLGYRSGVEGLFLSQDAVDYSTFLDEQGRRIKDSAVVANETAATKLTAESMGVLIQGVDQTNRIQAKSLEISSTRRIEESSKESARLQSFADTQGAISQDFETGTFSTLPSFDAASGASNSGGGQ